MLFRTIDEAPARPGRSAGWTSAAARGALADAPWLLSAAAILLLPAILWGRPFVFGDTAYYWGWGGDVLDALQRPWPSPGQPWTPGRSLHGWGFDLHDATPADLRFNLTWLTARSAFYAVPFRLLAGAGGLWLVAGLQALAAAWVVRLAVRALAPARSGRSYIAVIAGLAGLSSLGFEAAYAMPDIFGGLAIAAAALLTIVPDRLGRAERWGLVALIAYAVLAHAENGLNIAAAVVLGGLWRWRTGNGWRAALDRAAPTAIGLMIGLAVAAGGGFVLGEAFGRPVHMPPFAASRMLADGAGQAYLRRTCPQSALAPCDLAGRPPAYIEYYLWVYPLEAPPPSQLADRVGYSLAQSDRLQRRHVTEAEADQRERFVAEQGRLALGALGADGLHQLRGSLANALVAVLNFGVGRDFDTVHWLIRGRSDLRAELASILPGGVECAGSASATCGRFDLDRVTPLQYAAVVASLLLFAVCSLRRAAAPSRELADFLWLTLGLVIVDAILCGVISGPYARYQSRVEWLVPLGGLLLLAQLYGRQLKPMLERRPSQAFIGGVGGASRARRCCSFLAACLSR